MASSFPAVSVMELMGTVDWMSVGQFLMSALPVWLLGALIGLLLPRPKWLGKTSAFFATAEVGARLSLFGRLAMCFHGFMLIREIWFRFTSPGTFRRCCYAFCQLLRGRGWEFPAEDHTQQEDITGASGGKLEEEDVQWYISEADLAFFCTRTKDAAVPGGPWEKLMEKEISGQLKYTAWRRTLPSRKTEYMSVTVTADSSPHEVMDFYLNDPVRQRWDPMLTHTETLLEGKFSERQQVVHWVRSFPFSFLSDRDYVIGRRVFERDDLMYGISKAITFPSHNPGRLVPCDNYWSMWSHKAVACPWNSGKPATETLLLHMEDFKIPENLSRFAVRHGMWGFVQKMAPAMSAFVAERRAAGVPPNARDPNAFGSATTATPAPGSSVSGASTPPFPPRKSGDMRHCHSASDISSERPPVSAMKRVASAVVAGSMLIALGGLGQQLDANAKRARRQSQRQSRRANQIAQPPPAPRVSRIDDMD